MPVDGTKGCLRAFAQLKSQYRYLKLILSIGGAGDSNAVFSAVAADSAKRVKFASTARALVDQFSFDGIDSMSAYSPSFVLR
jgi:chitinase